MFVSWELVAVVEWLEKETKGKQKGKTLEWSGSAIRFR